MLFRSACITAYNLQPLFFNDTDIRDVGHGEFNPQGRKLLNKALKTDFQNIAEQWESVSVQMAQRLCKLAMYDVVLLVDDSSSIRTHNEDDGRLDDLEMMASISAEVAALFDDDGIDDEFLNNEEKYRGIREGRIASRILHDLVFRGQTKLGHALRGKSPTAGSSIRHPQPINVARSGNPSWSSSSPTVRPQVNQ